MLSVRRPAAIALLLAVLTTGAVAIGLRREFGALNDLSPVRPLLLPDAVATAVALPPPCAHAQVERSSFGKHVLLEIGERLHSGASPEELLRLLDNVQGLIVGACAAGLLPLPPLSHALDHPAVACALCR